MEQTSKPIHIPPAHSNSPLTFRNDDPLLLALVAISKLLHAPHSSEALTAGLPLVDHKLTIPLFIRAAERAGFSAGLVKRPLNQISDLVLPAVLLLRGNKTCVLLDKKNDAYNVLLPETGNGRKMLTEAQLSDEYTGSAIFVQVVHRFDDRTSDSITPKIKHWFWDVIYKSWPIYSEVMIATLLVNFFALASPLFVMNVYDRVVPNHAIETLWVLAIGVGIVFIFDFFFKALRSYFIDVAGKRADVILSATIFEKVMNLRMEAKPTSVGSFANNLHEFESFRDFLTSATLTALIDLPFLFLFIGIIAIIGGKLALIPLLLLPLSTLGALAVQPPLKRTISELYKFSAQKSATLIEAVSSIETLKGTGAEGQMQRIWEQAIGNVARLGMRSRLYSSLAINLTAFLQQIASVLIVVAGVYQIADGDLTTGALIACTLLTGRAMAPIGQIAALLTRYHQARAALDSINRLMSLPVEREIGRKFLHRSTISGTVEFKNVTFNYPDQPIKALDNISFKINAGERVAIIGRIGSGKSTLEKLIMGFYQAQEGSILIDGTDLRQIDPADLRRNIGYVPQDITLMYGSIKDNITLGARHADDFAVLAAAEIAGVTQFTNRHPAGFDLQVGERGASLSGGQRQSVAVARALLSGPPVYLMDEPTNAMDNSSEEAFKQRFANHLQQRTLILVTHRASLLTLVDRLIVIDGGRIVADGLKEQVLDALKQGQVKVAS